MADPATPYARAAAYIRVSTVAQAHSDRWSLPTQRDRFHAACLRERWEPCGEYTDVESGRRDTRPEYQRLLTAVRAGDVTVVVVQWLDRFGRNYKEILTRLWEIERLGGRVVATDEDIQHELIVMVKAWQANEESKRTSQRVKAVMGSVVSAGRWPGGVPYGYTLIRDPTSPTRGQWVVNDTAAAIVRRIFRIYTDEQIGLNKVAGRLNADGIASPRRGLWWASAVQFVLANRAYIGEPQWQGVVFPPGCLAIVDRDVWERAQWLLARRREFARRKPKAHAFLLDGLVRCACGTIRHSWICFRDGYVDRQGYRRRPIRYYRCAHQVQQQSCTVGLIDADVLEKWVLGEISHWQTTPEFLAQGRSQAAAGADPQAELARRRQSLKARIEQTQARLRRSYDEFMDGTVDRALYREKQAEYLEVIRQAQGELERLHHSGAFRDWEGIVTRLRSLQDLLTPPAGEERLSIEEKRELLGEVIDCVQVVGRREWRLVGRPDFGSLLT